MTAQPSRSFVPPFSAQVVSLLGCGATTTTTTTSAVWLTEQGIPKGSVEPARSDEHAPAGSSGPEPTTRSVAFGSFEETAEIAVDCRIR